jgi:hypothetical protein
VGYWPIDWPDLRNGHGAIVMFKVCHPVWLLPSAVSLCHLVSAQLFFSIDEICDIPRKTRQIHGAYKPHGQE